MMNKKDFVYIGIILCLVGGVVFNRMSIPRIGYVRALDMFEKYDGMKEASDLYETKQNKWHKQIDSLKNVVAYQFELYKKQKETLSIADQQKREAQLSVLNQNFQERVMAIEEEAKLADEKLTSSVLERINVFIEQYGKANGYSVIFATTSDGEMIYGDSSIDLTDVVVKELNKEYSGN